MLHIFAALLGYQTVLLWWSTYPLLLSQFEICKSYDPTVKSLELELQSPILPYLIIHFLYEFKKITWNNLKVNLVIIGLTLTIGLLFKVKEKVNLSKG